MTADETERPWEELEKLVEEAPPEHVESFLGKLPASEAARAIARLSEENQTRLFTTIAPEEAADLVESIPDVQAADVFENLPTEAAAAIIQEMPSDAQADLLGDLAEENAEAILAEMEPEAAREARALYQYPHDVAGGLMVAEYLAYPKHTTVAQVIEDMRTHVEEYRDYVVQYAYVTTAANRLVGVLRLRDLLLASRSQRIESLMVPHPLTVSDWATLDELREFFDSNGYYGVPVVEAAGELVGVVQRGAVNLALADRSQSDYIKSQGIIGGEELRSMPVLLRSRRRLTWLSANIFLNVISASVINAYQGTLQEVVTLAIFLPIISDMSGCTGNQAVAVSMRELALGVVRPTESFLVWLKEISVGLVNGLVLGILIALVAWLWKGNGYLGLVVGLALALNTLVAVSIGGTLPLILKRLGFDPALSSGPILTTITDTAGFFFVLSIASALLHRLTP